MAKIPSITEAEWKVMKVLWTKAPQPAYDVVQALSKTEGWHPNTVKTLLQRLHRKKALGITPRKNFYLYRPLVSEEACERAESQTFLDRLFGGRIQPLLVHFVNSRKLSKKDLEELRQILDRTES
jgi:BlaI family transcriptional regulator, penicillinase repressor